MAPKDDSQEGVEPSSTEIEFEIDSCLICCSENLSLERGITPCNHDTVCGPCHARLRYLHSDIRCPVCKTSNDRIIVDSDENIEGNGNRLYQDYGMWGDELGQDFILREDVKMFFRKSYHDEKVVPLFSLACIQKGCGYESMKGLRGLTDHMRVKHTLSFCTLCVDAKRDFISNLPRFTPEQLKRHMAKGDGKGSGFTGHPLCEFCRPTRFYDLTKLHEHLNKQHYKCHVCERQDIHNQFFKNYDKLALHFDRKHYLCPDPQCLAARFVVFDNEIDLRAHEISTHGVSNSNSSTKINLEFRVRRTGYDGSGYEEQNVPTQDDFQFGVNGEVFVPESLPGSSPNTAEQQQENEPEITDAVHAARTAEMRTHAAQIRRAQDSSETKEEFPDLVSDTSNQRLVGWTAEGRRNIRSRGGRGIVSQEAFPALPGVPDPTANFRKKTLSKKPTKPFSNIAGSVAAAASPFPTNNTIRHVQSSTNIKASQNNTSSLSTENFPSLGSSSSAKRVSSTPNFAKTLQSARTSPSISSYSTIPTRAQPSPTLRKQGAPVRPPTAADFPTLGGAISPTYEAANALSKQIRKANQSGKPKRNGTIAQALTQNIPVPPPMPQPMPPSVASRMDPMEQLSTLKSILGPTNYKKLRKLTKTFAMNQLAHEQYIDQVADIFPEGKKDADFWNFVPILVESCPDDGDGRNGKALEYMSNIRMAADMDDGLTPPPSQVSASASASATQSCIIIPNGRKLNPVPMLAVPPPPNFASRVGVQRQPNAVAAKGKKSAWNSSSKAPTAAVTRTKLKPGTSVLKDASNEKIERGTATKFMAKMNAEEKKMKQQSSGPTNGTSKKSKSKKKKNELRDLAFGR